MYIHVRHCVHIIKPNLLQVVLLHTHSRQQVAVLQAIHTGQVVLSTGEVLEVGQPLQPLTAYHQVTVDGKVLQPPAATKPSWGGGGVVWRE